MTWSSRIRIPERRYPDQGKGTYRVGWLLNGTKIGQTITFKR